MSAPRTERKLSAILAADVVGYSRLMGEDEEGTLARLNALLADLVEPRIADNRGRVVKRTGDGLLVDFASAIEAVRCAVAIQAALADRNRDLREGERIEFRIGINLGDVIIQDDDIFGDGVNIAARLESIAEPGGIFVSRAVRDSVRDKLGVALEDLGERTMKNIAQPVQVFRIARPDGVRFPTAAPSLPAKPSIAVLPFANMSGDAEQEYFSDGISEDLITDLSKVSALFVIARNSSFTYKGKSVRVQEIGRDLGVRFVLEGSIRKAGNRVRITAQLIDTQTGGHLWADRFDRELTDIFETQDEVVRHIVEALSVKLTRTEQQKRTGTHNVEAYESWLKARSKLALGTRDGVTEARALHERALALDPNFPAPHAGLTFVSVSDYVNGWGTDPDISLADAERHARRAIALDALLPVGYMALGNALVWQRRHDEALAALTRAIELDHNYAQGHALLGMALMYAGRPTEALEPFALAMRLDPLHPNIVLHLVAQTHFSLEQYEEAARYAADRIARNPQTDASRMLLASSYGHLGRADEARAAWQALLEVNPGFSLAQRARVLPYKNEADFRRIADGLAKAGISPS